MIKKTSEIAAIEMLREAVRIACVQLRPSDPDLKGKIAKIIIERTRAGFPAHPADKVSLLSNPDISKFSAGE